MIQKKLEFLGQQVDIAEHRKLGGRREINIACQQLSHVFDDDDGLQLIHDEYESGCMLMGKSKKITICEIWGYASKFQE